MASELTSSITYMYTISVYAIVNP